MVKLRGAISGTHPLGEDLIQSILDYKYGRAGNEPVISGFDQELNDLIQLQKDFNFPKVSTGNLGIEDLIRPFTRTLDSFHSYEELGDLPIVRYHFTNTFYRQPTLVKKLPSDALVLKQDENSLTGKLSYYHDYLNGYDSRIILPGPFSLTSLVEFQPNGVYRSIDDFLISAANYLAQEIDSLPEHYTEIQLDEPYFVWERIPRTLRPSVKDAYELLSGKIKNRDLIVHTYFESAENILSFLLELPVDGIGIDFFETNILSLKDFDFEGKILQAGLIDAQNFVPNTEGKVDETKNRFIVGLISTLYELNPKELIITPTTSLEYLPRDIADQKLKQIGNIVKTFKEEI